MKPCIEQWSIVITGQWNPQIFNAYWVSKNLLFAQDPSEIGLELGITQGLTSHIRLVTKEFMVLPSRERIQFHPLASRDQSAESAERAALRTLEILPHTPVTGYGLNFRYKQESVDSTLSELFNAQDYVELIKMNFEPVQRRVVRNLRVDDDFVLNMTFTLEQDSRLDIGLNFHKAVEPNSDLEAFSKNMVNKGSYCREIGLDILGKTYNLTLDMEEETDD